MAEQQPDEEENAAELKLGSGAPGAAPAPPAGRPRRAEPRRAQCSTTRPRCPTRRRPR